MKSSDYIIDFIANKGIKHIFGYQGTMIAHFVDSACRDNRVGNHSCYNEQGAGFAAVGYAKATGHVAVAYSTSGPGAANLVSAIADAFYDSAPVVFITGQLNSYEYLDIEGLRQNGFQEMDVVSTVRSITKYCVQIRDISELRYCLEKAFWFAETGRPGPVLIDLPMDMQRQEIDPETMKSFTPESALKTDSDAGTIAETIIEALDRSERPVLLLGNGITYGSEEHLKVIRFAETLRLPIITSMLARDLLPYESDLNFGHLGGGYGHRYANIIISKKSDLIISIGCSMCKRQTTAKTENFAKGARIIRVDIDPIELERKIHGDEISYCADCREVIAKLYSKINESGRKHDAWLAICSAIKDKLVLFDQECTEREPNHVMEMISDAISGNAIICCDVGQHQVWTAQSYKIKEGQQLLFSGGHGAMGFALPAAIGAHYATGLRTIAICGDGAMQMNIQELQWVFREQLPVTVVVLNNNSLGLIRQQQDDMLNGYYAASMADGGFTSPDFARIANAYGIESVKITDVDTTDSVMRGLPADRPVLVEVIMDINSGAYPKTYFGEEMYNQRPYIPVEMMQEILSL